MAQYDTIDIIISSYHSVWQYFIKIAVFILMQAEQSCRL